MTDETPPEHVLVAFGWGDVPPTPLGAAWEGGWRCGEVVLSVVADHARAAWSAKVRETLFVDGVRLARPVRSTDGRYVVSGWRADTFVAGASEPRHDEVVSVAVRLHEATAKLDRPRFLTQPPVAPWSDVDVFIAADRAAGYRLVMATASHGYYAAGIARRLGFDDVIATQARRN